MEVMQNKISRKGQVTIVQFDPAWLLKSAVYMPDGATLTQPNMTLGQMIEFIAFAWINARTPQFKDECNAAKIEFDQEALRFVVTFAKDVDILNDVG